MILRNPADAYMMMMMMMIMTTTVFWDVPPYSLVDVNRRFSGACCLYRQGDKVASASEMSVNFTRLQGSSDQKTVIFILAVMRT
jgi:hypothetical protein